MFTLGERLKKARENKGLKQVDVQARTNINNRTLSRYEKDGSEPDSATLKLLADLYEVSTDYLLGRTENKDNREDEFQKFANDPELEHFFKDMKESPREQVEELRKIWNIIKQRDE